MQNPKQSTLEVILRVTRGNNIQDTVILDVSLFIMSVLDNPARCHSHQFLFLARCGVGPVPIGDSSIKGSKSVGKTLQLETASD